MGIVPSTMVARERRRSTAVEIARVSVDDIANPDLILPEQLRHSPLAERQKQREQGLGDVKSPMRSLFRS